MKSILSQLLIVCSLLLCGLIAWQWQRESQLRQALLEKDRAWRVEREKVAARDEAAVNLQREIERLEKSRSELKNSLEATRKELNNALTDGDHSRRELDAHKKAFEEANARLREQNQAITALNDLVEKQQMTQEDLRQQIKEQNQAILTQNEIIEQQNQEMQVLADERLTLTENYNHLVNEYNLLAKRYEELRDLYEKVVQQLQQQDTQP